MTKQENLVVITKTEVSNGKQYTKIKVKGNYCMITFLLQEIGYEGVPTHVQGVAEFVEGARPFQWQHF